jgi:hypothetical protein
MYHVSWLLAMSLVIVGAAVALVVGVRRFNRRTGLDRYFVGEALLMLAWVFPEILIASHALILAGRVPTHPGDPYIAVGAIMGSAAANVLLIGILNTVWPGRGGLEVTGSGSSLVSAAVVLMVCCTSFIGLIIGAGAGIAMAQLVAGAGVTAVYLLGLRLVQRQSPKAAEPEPLFQPGGGTLIRAVGLAGFAAIALIYATPIFVEAADWGFRATEDAHGMSGKHLGIEVIVLGLLLAVPDLFLCLGEVKSKGGGAALPRLFLAAAALIAFTAVAGLDPDTLWNAFAASLLGFLGLTVFFVAVVVVLILATSVPRSLRMRGLIVLALAMAGMVFSIVILDRPPPLPPNH